VVLRLHADKAPPPPHSLNPDLPAVVTHPAADKWTKEGS
jgi:hypothetical protein